MSNTLATILASSVVVLGAPAVAHADDPVPTTTGGTEPSDESLPPPSSDDDPKPEVAGVARPPGGLVTQAGVGGDTAYGRAGVLELGGSAGVTLASDLREVNISPSIGWFLADNLQLSALVGVSHVGTSMDTTTMLSALAEPSYHLPFNRSVFGFLGVGLGGSYVDSLGGGLAVAPRLGANVLIGRSGVLSPSISWQYTTHDVSQLSIEEKALVSVSSALRMNVGYTVMW